jgi:hypothetical protein
MTTSNLTSLKQLVRLVCYLLILLTTLSLPIKAAEAIDDALWSQVLKQHVDEKGFVNYDALLADRTGFDQYIKQLQTTSPASHPELFSTEADQLAYYINAYNAMVFKGVIDRGPEKESVWKGFVSGLNFFVRMDIKLGGKKTNLKKLEDKVVRAQFQDPRIHAALNCASVSCPRLIQQPYTAEQLNTQLETVMREFLSSDQHIQLDNQAQTVHANKILKWYDSDFLAYEKTQGNTSGSKHSRLISYINRYRAEALAIPLNYKLSFLDYDKGINAQ